MKIMFTFCRHFHWRLATISEHGIFHGIYCVLQLKKLQYHEKWIDAVMVLARGVQMLFSDGCGVIMDYNHAINSL